MALIPLMENSARQPRPCIRIESEPLLQAILHPENLRRVRMPLHRNELGRLGATYWRSGQYPIETSAAQPFRFRRGGDLLPARTRRRVQRGSVGNFCETNIWRF